jgi:hypothetical protein
MTGSGEQRLLFAGLFGPVGGIDHESDSVLLVCRMQTFAWYTLASVHQQGSSSELRKGA